MKTTKYLLFAAMLLIAATQLKAQTPTVNASINNITTAYLDVKDALAADDGATAEAKAKILNSKIAGVPSEDMNPSQQLTWRKYADKLSFDSRHISETAGIDHQREHFSSLSKNMYDLLKTFNSNTTAIYWQYCPMKKVSWLSATTDIKNPYYGKKMLDCGSTKETLKAGK